MFAQICKSFTFKAANPIKLNTNRLIFTNPLARYRLKKYHNYDTFQLNKSD